MRLGELMSRAMWITQGFAVSIEEPTWGIIDQRLYQMGAFDY